MPASVRSAISSTRSRWSRSAANGLSDFSMASTCPMRPSSTAQDRKRARQDRPLDRGGPLGRVRGQDDQPLRALDEALVLLGGEPGRDLESRVDAYGKRKTGKEDLIAALHVPSPRSGCCAPSAGPGLGPAPTPGERRAAGRILSHPRRARSASCEVYRALTGGSAG